MEEKEKRIKEKVNPIVKNIIKESRAAGLTLSEFHILAQLVNWEYEKAKDEAEKIMLNKVFYFCSHCERAIINEKKEKYFIYPNCENVLCKADNLKDFNNNYCGNCGYKLASAKNEALALVKKENMKIKNMVELKSQSARKKIMRYKNGRPYFEER